MRVGFKSYECDEGGYSIYAHFVHSGHVSSSDLTATMSTVTFNDCQASAMGVVRYPCRLGQDFSAVTVLIGRQTSLMYGIGKASTL